LSQKQIQLILQEKTYGVMLSFEENHVQS